MTTYRYKGYFVRVTGLSHYIYRPGRGEAGYSDGYAQSKAEAKRWINSDIAKVRS